jgi:hypothetical protein
MKRRYHLERRDQRSGYRDQDTEIRIQRSGDEEALRDVPSALKDRRAG